MQRLTDRVTRPLNTDDTVERALEMMTELDVNHLPVISDSGHLVGLLSESQLMQAPGPDAPLGYLLGAPPVSVRLDMHVFDVTKVLVQHDLSLLPVADPQGCYVGFVRRRDIFNRFAQMLSTQEPGAILALEISPQDYSLSQLVYIIEQNDIKILSIATESPETMEGEMRITLKLDTNETVRARHMLEHYGYRVVASFSEGEDDDDLRHRVQEFMRYLEV